MSLRPTLVRLTGACLLLLALPAPAVDPLRAPAPLAAPPADATETATGMAYKVLSPAPDPGRFVDPRAFVEYRLDAWSADGVTRANSRQDGAQLATIRRLSSEQPALARALLTTPVGETRRWWIHADRLKPGYPGMPDLPHVYDLTVLGIGNPVQVPPDVSGPPADAIRRPSGLAYKVLERGPGTGGHPDAGSQITIHYSGWTTDGRMFDSSVARDERVTFPLAQLIPGWQEGVPLMQRGDRFRFWIPGELAYDLMPGSGPDTPRGMLVFDVTLYDFTPGR